MYALNQFYFKQHCFNVSNLKLKHTSVKVLPKQVNKKYTDTINLPKSNFPLWFKGIKRVARDEQIIKERGFETLYNWQRLNLQETEFILHDGPPYANGVPHMGHAINKILKDITVRHKLLQGNKVHFKPGWDCHGLPIELKAMTGLNTTKMSPLKIRKKARDFAKQAIENQRSVFKSWGVMADWKDGCYFTFHKSYIQNQLQQFYNLFKKGLIFRDLKPVYWSPDSRTALAEAELEYKDNHQSKAMILKFPVIKFPTEWGFHKPVYGLIWTTTPWTIPANEAIAYSLSLQYCIIKIGSSEELYIVAKDLVQDLQTQLNKEVHIVKTIQGFELKGIKYKHPLDERDSLPFLAGSHVTATKGTGLVHIAPAHGPEDFLLAKDNNIPVSCHVDEKGCFTDALENSLGGLEVLGSGTEKITQLMSSLGMVLHTETIQHSYPYDWRTKTPVIFRASDQWFINTDAIKTKAVEALKSVNIIPDRGVAGLVSQLQRRPYWCISRQRVWGVPIPILYNKKNKEPIINKTLVNHYCSLLDSIGEDFWWSCSLQELVPNNVLSELDLSWDDLEKSQDILDIWFDSGLTWSSVLDNIADVYLEGVDQFTGWFQSSLMTSIALRDVAPYRTVFVHGFAVDGNGHKMSKSVGNVVNPQDITRGGVDLRKQPPYGVDTLRWWVANHSTQHTNIPISINLLDSSSESVHKFRMVMKFLLGATFDVSDIEEQPQLRLLDRYLLHSLLNLNKEVINSYNKFEYNKVCNMIINFVTNQVSGLYCHVTKDRLYCDEINSPGRRAAQTTMVHIVNVVCHLLAPILPILAEEVYMYHPIHKESKLLFHQIGSMCKEEWNDPEVESVINLALLLKKDVSKAIPLNCSNFEVRAVVTASLQTYQKLQLLQEEEQSCSSDLVEILQVSSVKLCSSDDLTKQFSVEIKNIDGTVCPRCRCRNTVENELCSRCSQVIQDKQQLCI